MDASDEFLPDRISELNESLILRAGWLQQRSGLSLTLRCPERAFHWLYSVSKEGDLSTQYPDVDFRWVCFEYAENFADEMQQCSIPGLIAYTQEHATRKTLIVYGFSLLNELGGKQLDFEVSGFGRVRLICRKIAWRQKICKIDRSYTNEWVYIDRETDERVEFSNPFGE